MPSESTVMVFDVAIVSYNTDAYLHNLLTSLRDRLPPGRIGAVHVWDNGSTDATPALLSTFGTQVPWLRVHRSRTNIQHGPALDRLLRDQCTAEWVLLLDSDTEVLRDFLPALSQFGESLPTFIGQIHPQPAHLYAYLAHLLIHRPTYLTLPPFRDDGAPGDEYFRAVAARQLRYERFRWCDYVSHAGQATLRGLHARVETAHPLYAFAEEQVQSTPLTADRAAHEARLRDQFKAFLAAGRGGEMPGPSHECDLPAEPAVRAPRRSWLADARTFWRGGIDAARDPHAALEIHRARRIGLVQQVPEIRELFRRVRHLRPRRVLEIGTAYGGSLYLWTRAAAPEAQVISVDLPPWEVDEPWEVVRQEQFRAFGSAGQSVELIRADSHDPDTLERVREALGGEPLDFLFVDGDHTHDGVRRDVADYGALLRPGGLMALHDIHPHSEQWGGDVPTVWRELRAGRRAEEIIADSAQDGFGIGLLWA